MRTGLRCFAGRGLCLAKHYGCQEETITAKSAKSMILLQDITIRVRDRFLFAGASWEILDGENWAVVGPNGAGKTALARALAGEVPVVGGRISMAEELRLPGCIGYLSFERLRELIASEEARDESRFFSGRNTDGLTTRRLLADTIRSKDTAFSQMEVIIRRMELEELLDRQVRVLSNGEIRMVMIARELMKAPRLLILDEPFSGLDESCHRRLAEVIGELIHKDLQLILVTHHLEEIGPHFTHVLGVKNGGIRFQETRNQGLDPGRIERLYADAADRPKSMLFNGSSVSGKDIPNAEAVVIKMKNVSVRYGQRSVLRNLNWTVRRNENWQISGPNGAGKTTLLGLVAAEHPQAYANEIYLFGRRRGSGESIWDIKNRIGMISSEFQIRYRKPIPAFDVVLSGFFDSVGLYRRATLAQRKLANRWMQALQMVYTSERLFHTLSQGEQRMVLLVRAMIKSPDLLILDEPCQGLDPAARKHLLELIDRIGRQTATQLMYVTHKPAEVLTCITHEMRFEKSEGNGFRVVQGPIGAQKPKGEPAGSIPDAARPGK